MKNFAILAVFAAFALAGLPVQAKDAAPSKAVIRALAELPPAELPAAASKVVASTSKENRAAVVDALVRRVAKSQPNTLRHVVAAIAKSDAGLAATAASSAAKVKPESVGEIATAACGAAPAQAAQVIAACSKATSANRGTISEVVARANPVFSAELLTRQSSEIEVTADAATVTGGTVIVPLPPAPGTVGITLQGDPVLVPPANAGTSEPGADPDRYAEASGN